jgi:hypothetical protein
MALSISSSRASALFFARLLAGICVCLSMAFEIASHYLLKHHSETYARVSQQYAEAVKVRPPMSGEPIPVVLVGNSLLLDGVDISRLQGMTFNQMRIYPIFLEATGYYDWFYGLRHLFREGARPPVVVVGFGADSFLANSVRQDYVPLMLFDLQDSLGAASDLQMDRTATSNLLLAHTSVFWDTRSVIRTQILRRLIPGYRELVGLLKPQSVVPPTSESAATLNWRLRRLRDLCEDHGARLILLVPPTPSSAELVRQVVLAAHGLGVEALVPLDPGALSAKYYQSDELHLNSEGAALFTSALATVLPRTVARESMPSPGLTR